MTAKDGPIDRAWLIAALRKYQAGWANIGRSANERGETQEYWEARGAYVALRQVRKLLLEDPEANRR